MYQNPFLQNTQPLKPIIGELVEQVNLLIKEVSPNGDYHIDTVTGAILGNRQKPSLTGDVQNEQGTIGWIAVGGDGAGKTGEYFQHEPFSAHIDHIRILEITNLEERIANLRDPNQLVTRYDTITVACTTEELFIQALIVALEERGFVVETTVAPNYWGPKYNHANGMQPQWRSTMVRVNRQQFIERWVPALKGMDFLPNGAAWYAQSFGEFTPAPVMASQLTTDPEQPNNQPE